MHQFIPYDRTTLGGFWGRKQRQVRTVTIPYQWDALNDRVPGADRSGAVKNFRIAAGRSTGEFQGFFFQDSDLAKWVEAASYALATEPNAPLEKTVDRVVDLIIAAQDSDGYLNTYYTIKESPEKRWSDLRDMHELYVAGHMLEAGIAYFEATGKRRLLDACLKNVDLIARLFGRRKGQSRGYPGHPELELALMRLYELTDDPKHLHLASYFIDERGRTPRYFDAETKRLGKKDFRSDEWYAIYNQSHVPIRDQKDIVGHAVRACYLMAAAADVARVTEDASLRRAVKRLWRSATERRMYVTGGVGSTLLGEAFTFDYDLPNEWAYAETCAAIALIFWSRRMLRLEVDRKYADVMEKTLYNGFLSALSHDGTHCFYRNPLASVPDSKYPKRHVRRAWHECACCPPNVSRLMMSLGGYVYSMENRRLFVHLFVDSDTSFEVGGANVRLVQQTEFPWDEQVTMTLHCEKPTRFGLHIRIPGWCRGAVAKVNGERVPDDAVRANGYMAIDREWTEGDTVALHLPMKAERVYPHPKVRQDAGRVALQRGPVLYCLEEADNGADLHEVVLGDKSKVRVEVEDTEWGRLPILRATGIRRRYEDDSDELYRRTAKRRDVPVDIRAIPYHLWANRGMAEMIVWMRDGS